MTERIDLEDIRRRAGWGTGSSDTIRVLCNEVEKLRFRLNKAAELLEGEGKWLNL